MLRRMSVVQWLRWKQYMLLAPFGEEREDARAALIAQAIWNVQIAKNAKKGTTPVFRKLWEFLFQFGDSPDYSAPTRKQSSKEQWDTLVNTMKMYATPSPEEKQN